MSLLQKSALIFTSLQTALLEYINDSYHTNVQKLHVLPNNIVIHIILDQFLTLRVYI
jgi:hypothetical protein